jgi:hypothetical protein
LDQLDVLRVHPIQGLTKNGELEVLLSKFHGEELLVALYSLVTWDPEKYFHT